MADEASFSGTGIDRNSVKFYNYATGTAITKGAFFIFDLTRPFTVNAHGTSNANPPAGIVVEDRDSDDTQQDRIGLLRKANDILLVADGVIAVGDALMLGTTANRVMAMPSTSLSTTGQLGKVIGWANEASAAGRYFSATLDIKA